MPIAGGVGPRMKMRWYTPRRRSLRRESEKREQLERAAERVVEIGQAITLIMKGIHSTASPTVSLSDVVADSCLNLIGPYVRPSVHPSGAPSAALSFSLTRDFFYDIV